MRWTVAHPHVVLVNIFRFDLIDKIAFLSCFSVGHLCPVVNQKLSMIFKLLRVCVTPADQILRLSIVAIVLDF